MLRIFPTFSHCLMNLHKQGMNINSVVTPSHFTPLSFTLFFFFDQNTINTFITRAKTGGGFICLPGP